MSSTTYPFTPKQRAQAQRVDAGAGHIPPGTPYTYFDRQGFPCTLGEWAVMFEDQQYKRVRQDEVNGSTVSTVWLGLDHGYGGLPLIFETMVFGADDEEECRRYSTEAEAIAGHNEVVEKLKAQS